MDEKEGGIGVNGETTVRVDNRRLRERSDCWGTECTGGNEGLSEYQTRGQRANERGTKPRDGGFVGREGRRTFLGEEGVM